jgi:hypothetical protein
MSVLELPTTTIFAFKGILLGEFTLLIDIYLLSSSSFCFLKYPTPIAFVSLTATGDEFFAAMPKRVLYCDEVVENLLSHNMKNR